MARKHDVQVFVDGAHAFAHFPFTRDELGCDYYGASLHKWCLAPIGAGMFYVRRERIKDLWPLMAAAETQDADIRKFEEIGTHPAAMHNAIAEALEFHHSIGGDRKAARLRYLRNRWARRLHETPGAKVLTSFDPAQGCAIGLLALGALDPEKVTSHLWARHRIIVTPIKHAEFQGLRVTPNLYTTLGEIDTFVAAIEDVLKNGVS
jgi:selenocysteine lyase/cysteine desulfurase